MALALETVNLEKHFGGIVASRSVSLKIEQGSRHAIIGPNGAGKTTIVNLLTGVLRPTVGRILLDGHDITDMPVHRRVGRGLARTFQINQLFADLTPLDTISLALCERQRRDESGWRILREAAGTRVEAMDILIRFGLDDVKDDRTSVLPYGKQRLLEIALAIACRPRVLLLDEPAAGVPEGEREELLATIAALSADVTVLLIEHDMDLVFSFAQRISVLVNGAVLVEGSPEEVAADRHVRAAYLGEDADA